MTAIVVVRHVDPPDAASRRSAAWQRLFVPPSEGAATMSSDRIVIDLSDGRTAGPAPPVSVEPASVTNRRHNMANVTPTDAGDRAGHGYPIHEPPPASIRRLGRR